MTTGTTSRCRYARDACDSVCRFVSHAAQFVKSVNESDCAQMVLMTCAQAAFLSQRKHRRAPIASPATWHIYRCTRGLLTHRVRYRTQKGQIFSSSRSTHGNLGVPACSDTYGSAGSTLCAMARPSRTCRGSYGFGYLLKRAFKRRIAPITLSYLAKWTTRYMWCALVCACNALARGAASSTSTSIWSRFRLPGLHEQAGIYQHT